MPASTAVQPPPHQPPQDPIMAALSQVPRAQLYDAVATMKQIVLTDPDRARQMLSQNPMLAIIMLNMQTMLGMLKPQAAAVAPAPVAPAPVLGMFKSEENYLYLLNLFKSHLNYHHRATLYLSLKLCHHKL